MNIQDLIPIGSEKAITRNDLLEKCQLFGIAGNDRQMRSMIEQARKNTVILNMQDGRGYFRPSVADKDKLKHYVSQESDRYISIAVNQKIARALLEDMEHERLCV